MYLYYSFCVSGAGYRSWPWGRIRYDENYDVVLLRNESDTEKSTKYLKYQSLYIEQAFIKHHYSEAYIPFAELPNQTWSTWLLFLLCALKTPHVHLSQNICYSLLQLFISLSVSFTSLGKAYEKMIHSKRNTNDHETYKKTFKLNQNNSAN